MNKRESLENFLNDRFIFRSYNTDARLRKNAFFDLFTPRLCRRNF